MSASSFVEDWKSFCLNVTVAPEAWDDEIAFWITSTSFAACNKMGILVNITLWRKLTSKGPVLHDGQFGFWFLSSHIPICETIQSLQLKETQCTIGEAYIRTHNWCMQSGIIIGFSISLKQMGHSPNSLPFKFATKLSENDVAPPSSWPSVNRLMRSFTSTFPSASGDEVRSSSLVATRLGCNTARRSLSVISKFFHVLQRAHLISMAKICV